MQPTQSGRRRRGPAFPRQAAGLGEKTGSGAGAGMQAAGLGEGWAKLGRRRQSTYATNQGGMCSYVALPCTA